MYAGKRFRIEIDGYDYFESLAKQPSGFIQLSSHIGNYEIAGYSLVAEDKPFNALVFFGEKESVMRNRNQMFSDTNIRMISVKEDMSHLFLIDNAITQGEIVSMPADRIFGSSKSIDVNLLGNVASFPMGPFSVATMRSLDVLSVNVMKESCMTYKIYVKPLHYDKNLPRKQQIAQLVTKYVEELEHMLKLYPAQWYNYFEFWQS
jgi:predicted LPLAT superfamily acyltransferase